MGYQMTDHVLKTGWTPERAALFLIAAHGARSLKEHSKLSDEQPLLFLADLQRLWELVTTDDSQKRLDGLRRREAKLFPSRGVKLPCLSAGAGADRARRPAGSS